MSNTVMEEEKINIQPKKKRQCKERISKLIKRSNGDSIVEMYEDILAENKRLNTELDKSRASNINLQKEIDELRYGLLYDRFSNLIE